MTHHRAKLTAQQVRRIRKLYQAGGVSYVTLGLLFGVSSTTISIVVHRDTWRHVGSK